jgi:hypothetical protein
MSSINNNALNFIEESPVDHLSAATIMFKIMEVDLTLSKKDLFKSLSDSIEEAKNQFNESSNHYKKLCNITSNQVII